MSFCESAIAARQSGKELTKHIQVESAILRKDGLRCTRFDRRGKVLSEGNGVSESDESKENSGSLLGSKPAVHGGRAGESKEESGGESTNDSPPLADVPGGRETKEG